MNIPDTLIERRQWVTWRYEDDPKRPDKPKKMPKNPATGNNAQTNNAQTWGTYQQAQAALSGRKHSGVGFVFTDEDPFVGGDLDGCRNPETGEIDEWAKTWIDRLLPVAYIEVSPSGKGVKFVAEGELPKALKVALGEHTGVELYAQRRFFTITGRRLEGCAETPQPAQELLDELYSHFAPVAPAPTFEQPREEATETPAASTDWRSVRILAVVYLTKQWVDERVKFACEQLSQAPSGNKHNRRIEMGRLLGGVIAAAPAYLSSADAERILYQALPPGAHAMTEQKAIRDGIATGLLSPLPLPAFPTDHDLLIDSRASCPACKTRVQRSKFDYPGSNQKAWYCPRCKFPMVWPSEANTGTVSAEDEPRALSHDDDSVTALPLLIQASQLGQLPPAVSLIPDLLYRNRLHLFFGAPGSGKSYIALDLACIIAQYAPVVYLAAEAIEDYEARVEAWCAHYGLSVDNLYFWREPVRLAFPQDVDRFVAAAKVVSPVMIFVDPLADCMGGLVESTSEGMSVAVQALNHIRRSTGAGVSVVHHSGWSDERERGSSLLRGAARIVVKVEQRDDGLIAVSCIKKNQGKPFAPRSFRLISSGELGAVVPVPSGRVLKTGGDKPSERALKVLEELTTQPLRNGATHKQIMDATGYPAGTLNRLLTGLTDNRYVVSQDKGRSTVYLITDLGEKVLEEALNWGDQDSALGRGSSNSFQISVMNWRVNTDSLPTAFQRPDAVLPTSSSSSSKKSVPSSTSFPAYISGEVEEHWKDEEEEQIEADLARVEQHRKTKGGYQEVEGY